MADPSKPTVRQGPADASGTQLPKGAAQNANQAYAEAQGANEAPTGAQAPQSAGAETTEGQVEPTLVPRPRQGPIPLQSEEDNLLFGPTGRPTESITTGNLPNGRIPLPPNINKMIPILTQAVQDPDAPPQLRGLLQLLMHHANEV